MQVGLCLPSPDRAGMHPRQTDTHRDNDPHHGIAGVYILSTDVTRETRASTGT